MVFGLKPQSIDSELDPIAYVLMILTATEGFSGFHQM